MKACADKPCPTCPWRKSSTTGGADIPNFEIDMMRRLANTVPPQGSEIMWPRKVFACHNSKEHKEFACAGYVARHGEANPLLRIQLGVDVERIKANCEDLDLYDNFHEMLADYEIALGNKPAGVPGLAERYRIALDECVPGEQRWIVLERASGISAELWESAYRDGTEPSSEMIEALMRTWSSHGIWVLSGVSHMEYVEQLREKRRKAS